MRGGGAPSVQAAQGGALWHKPETCFQQAWWRALGWPVLSDRSDSLVLPFPWQQEQIALQMVIQLLHQVVA